MCEILFRGKRMDNGQWVEAVSILRAVDGAVKEMYIAAKAGVELAVDSDGNLHAMTAGPHVAYYLVDPETVGQFTGLTDKNGRKIFEGDVLRGEDILVDGEIQIKGDMWSVAMHKGCWTVMAGEEWDFLGTNAHRCEVIGNIHDNPELLDQ